MKSRYQTKPLVYMQCSLLFFICRKRKKHLAGALLRDSRATRCLGTMVTIPFLKDLPSPAMQTGTSWDLPACTSLSMLGGNLPIFTIPSMLVRSSPLLSMLRAPGIRAQVRNGRMATLTTTSNNHMRRSRVAIRKDICPSLPMATMTSL